MQMQRVMKYFGGVMPSDSKRGNPALYIRGYLLMVSYQGMKGIIQRLLSGSFPLFHTN